MALALRIVRENPDQPDVRAELAEADKWYLATYPAESINTIDLAELMAPNVTFFAARDQEGRLLGFGAVVECDGYAEIKRMYVSQAARGMKVSRRILERLEAHAISRGFTVMRLETGPLQPEALGLYQTHGYQPIPHYADYDADDPNSLCFEKRLGS
ncbi:MAG: GNAT family N-acetyltransferase [Alphaproteobacteria bacterium]|nr:GNAT family N-acetyltransferase [Alphaproteobacteria bacterium]MCW5739890.1 GNAT family N-acetyltransferase [Alphaproteobacteria bacterium]